MSKMKVTPTLKSNPEHEQHLREAARLHAQADRSNPFAYSRIMLYMRTMGPEGGYSHFDVKKDAERMLGVK